MRKRKYMLHLTDAEFKDLLVRLYETEQRSVLAMSKELNVSREFISYWLQAFGINLRGASESMRVRHANMTPEERKQLVSKAHDSLRGQSHSLFTKIVSAESRSRTARMSKWEKWFAKWLIDADIYDFIFSYPLDIYNLDFAIPSHKIAIEIDGGNWHATPRKQQQDENKETYLASEGWTIYRVSTAGWKSTKEDAPEYTAAFHRKASEVIEELKIRVGR